MYTQTTQTKKKQTTTHTHARTHAHTHTHQFYLKNIHLKQLSLILANPVYSGGSDQSGHNRQVSFVERWPL